MAKLVRSLCLLACLLPLSLLAADMPLRIDTRYDLSDAAQYDAFVAQLKRAGVTAETRPKIYPRIVQARGKATPAPTAGAKAPLAVITAAGIGASRKVTADATLTVPAVLDIAIVTVVLTDEDGKAIAPAV